MVIEGDEPTRSRIPSAATCQTDLPDGVDVPIADAVEPQQDDGGTGVQVPGVPSQSTASSSGQKRKFDGPAGDDNRAEDPDDPVDSSLAGSLEVPQILGLGERKYNDKQTSAHGGRYDLCELFSPPRVTAAATRMGLQGGWSLDREPVDPVTRSAWDLGDSRAQARIWKMLRRDKPLVIGLSPPCT